MPKVTQKHKTLSVVVISPDVVKHMEMLAKKQHTNVSSIHRQAIHYWHERTLDEFQALLQASKSETDLQPAIQ